MDHAGTHVAHADSSPRRRAASPPVPRAPRLALEGVPRHWFAGSFAPTHIANGVNLLFPAGERFFIRSVRRYLDRVGDPKRAVGGDPKRAVGGDAKGADAELAAAVRGFFGQEGRHAQAHERFFDTLRAQGYDVDAILRDYERVAYGIIEKSAPPPLRLAVTVALEHFTAILAEDALAGAESGASALAHAHPAVRRLLEWHAVEELEHKAVAFDVLRAVHPSYALRVAGLALATATLSAFWVAATRRLLAEDGKTLLDAARELARLRDQAARAGDTSVPKPIVRRVFLRGIREYLRPGFHPNDRDHRPLIEATLARLAEEGVVASAAAPRSSSGEVTVMGR